MVVVRLAYLQVGRLGVSVDDNAKVDPYKFGLAEK